MKLHDLKPAPGSTHRRIRVGRGIAAGKGKTAGRGTKGQKSRSGASIPGWFEGGQTPIHVRVPKLRGFKPINRIDYQVVNVGRISEYAAAGRFGTDAGSEPLTVNAEVLASAGLISHADRPVKVLGGGDLDVKVFVAADAFTASAKAKIEEAGGQRGEDIDRVGNHEHHRILPHSRGLDVPDDLREEADVSIDQVEPALVRLASQPGRDANHIRIGHVFVATGGNDLVRGTGSTV